MDYNFNTRLKGNLTLTSDFHANQALRKDKTLYKFIWVQNGTITLEIDHIDITLGKDELISLTPLHHIEFKEINGTYLTLLFNSNFYCIYGHDQEVSCNGFLFNGTSSIIRLQLSDRQSALLHEITDKLDNEYQIKDNLQEEMLRILLKRFIIACTRIAREKFAITTDKEKSFDIIRQYYVLVDQHFKEKRWCRNMQTCCTVLPKPCRIFSRATIFLLPCASFTSESKPKPNDCCFTPLKMRRKLPIFWGLKTYPHSAVSLKI